MSTELRMALGLLSCTMLVVGNMIGVGIFTTPGRITVLLPTSGLVMLAWPLGAGLTISGALFYAELGAAYPEAGGNYVFLRESYGPLWGFLYGWSAAFITQSGTIAILAVGFTKYAGISSPVLVQACAIGLILFFGALNYIGVKWIGRIKHISGLKSAQGFIDPSMNEGGRTDRRIGFEVHSGAFLGWRAEVDWACQEMGGGEHEKRGS